MDVLLLMPSVVGLLVAASWAWQLLRHWDTPPPQWVAPPNVAFWPFPMTVHTWQFAIVSGVVGGLAVAVVAYVGLH